MDRRLVKVIGWLMIVGNQTASVGLGQVRVIEEPKSEVRAQQAAVLAAKLGVVLPTVLEQLRARRRELAEAGYPRDGVAALLDTTETSLQKELQAPGSSPLREHTAEIFDEVRRHLELPTRTALHSSPVPQAIVASLRFVRLEEVQESLDRHRTDTELNLIEAFIADLWDRATRNDLIVDLCVLSDPPKAKVTLQAKDGEGIDPTKTNGRLVNLFRGKYFYTVEKRSLSKLAGPIDLYSKKQPVLDCAWDGGGCAVRDGWAEACREL
ncbi:MAG TPA: hypothetical protein VEW48_22470 [Thermoanaerobaculia bacterium]|nr:hypothetical protein [Thermoanaerobaculia bacterium]